jgi:hypothetical protein
MLIVASEIDGSSERIVRYLSDTYGVGINVATFGYFKNADGKEFLTRIFLIEPEQVENIRLNPPGSKRKPPLTPEELRDLANQNGVGELYTTLVKGLRPLFDQLGTTRSSVAFKGTRQNTILSFIPSESSVSNGLRFQVYNTRLADFLGVSEQEVASLLPEQREPWEYYKGAIPWDSGFVGFFRDSEAGRGFLAAMNEVCRGSTSS